VQIGSHQQVLLQVLVLQILLQILRADLPSSIYLSLALFVPPYSLLKQLELRGLRQACYA
jgi:hypothetical protein